MTRKISILGSTGSVGQQTLSVIRLFPDEFQVVGLTAGDNTKLLLETNVNFLGKEKLKKKCVFFLSILS